MPTAETGNSRIASPRRLASHRRGLTMVEVVVTTMLVGIVLVGAMNGVGSVLQMWQTAERRHDGLALAEQLLAEVLQQRYEEPDSPPAFGTESPEAGDNRSLWDDVDDYDGWSGSPEDKGNTPLAGFDSWTRSVTVHFADIDDPTQTSVSDQGLKRITVTVTDPAGQVTVLSAYRSQWGVLQTALESDTTVQTLATSDLEVGANVKLYGGTLLKNHAQDKQ